MEMHANSSSFKANLTLERRNSFRDVSFSSYLNKAEENMVRMLANQAAELPNDHHNRLKPEEDEEIGVFGAEKYFKGEIEDEGNNNDQRFIDTTDTIEKMHQQDEELEEIDHNIPVKPRADHTNIHTPSVRSNVSCNSRSRLLPPTKQSPVKIEIRSKTRNLLARFGCNCMNKKSTQINDKRFINTKEISKKHTKMLDFHQKTDQFSTQLADMNTRNDYFTFPVLNSTDLNSISSSNSKYGNLAGKTEGDKNGGRLKKITLLNDWDMGIRRGDEIYITSSRMYNNNNNDVDSDSSSDLFEIESFSPITGDGSFLGHRKSESNGYAPSEVSVDWSVVTASAADFSVVSDYDDVRTGGGGWRSSGGNVQITDERDEKKKRNGVLSGCVSHKAVRVAGDEYKISGGGSGVGGGGGGRRRLSESMAVGSVFRGGIV